MYLRQNATQEFIWETRDTSQPTISRYAAVLVPLVKAVLEEFVPDAAEAIEIVRGVRRSMDGGCENCGCGRQPGPRKANHGDPGSGRTRLRTGVTPVTCNPLPEFHC